MSLFRALRGTIALIVVVLPAHVLAGGGAQDVVVVVNQDSWASQAVANHYVKLRNIPGVNVIRLSDVPSPDQTDIDTFRERVLSPVLRTIRERGLDHITTIAYSADFPWGINVRSDFSDQELPKVLTPVASINGLTYLHQEVLASDHQGYLRLNSNRYVRAPQSNSLPGIQQTVAPLLQEAGKHARTKRWSDAESALRVADQKQPNHPLIQYNLSCCLAMQDKLDEAMTILTQAVNNGWSRRRSLEESAELRPLRARADFRELAESMPATARCEPSISFDRRVLWSPQRRPMLPPQAAFPPLESSEEAAILRQRASSYVLSTVLGVTSGRGNSVQEVLESLERSVAADHTRPDGVIYFPTNANIRSKTREPLYASAVEELQRLGVAAESKPGILPQDKEDVAGAMIGTATFDWNRSGSRILPGAICEHLTSLGGVMRENGGQTPLSEFIRHGAAGSSGTVTEPYAIQAKFPLPFLHVHYARGCSLAESFYQSVAGPYQLLIVGDPLCQPWSQPPEFSVRGIPSEPMRRGETLQLQLEQPAGAEPIIGVKCFVDGRLVSALLNTQTVALSTATMAGGIHELRVVAYGRSQTRPQAGKIFPLEIAAKQTCSLKMDQASIQYGDELVARLVSSGDIIRAELRHQGRALRVATESPTWTISTDELGIGASRLYAVVLHRDGTVVQTAPVDVSVAPPSPMEPDTEVPSKLQPGLALRWANGAVDRVTSTLKSDWLSKLQRGASSNFRSTAYYKAPQGGLHQLQVRSNFPLSIEIDGHKVLEVTSQSTNRWHYAPAMLIAGEHRFEFTGTTNAQPRATLRFGLQGAASVDERFRSEP